MEKPWDYIDAMTVDKKDLDMSDPAISKNYSPYMVNRWLSSVDMFIPIVNEINQHGQLYSKQSHYNFLKSVLPRQKIYIDYKAVKIHKDLDLKEIKYIALYFQVGIKEAKMYINMLSDKEIKDILKTFKYGMNKMVEV